MGTVKGTKKGGRGGQRLTAAGSYDHACMKGKGKEMEFPEPRETLSHRRGAADRSCCLGRKQPLPEKEKMWPRAGENSKLTPLHAHLLLVPPIGGTQVSNKPRGYSPWNLSFLGHRANTKREWLGAGNRGRHKIHQLPTTLSLSDDSSVILPPGTWIVKLTPLVVFVTDSRAWGEVGKWGGRNNQWI